MFEIEQLITNYFVEMPRDGTQAKAQANIARI